jgi:aerobic carbon-monoxide dehydrogenase medium subunit
MKAAKFGYERARSLAEACASLRDENALAIAGGQSLIPMLNLRVALPELIVDLGGLEELKGISQENGSLHFGALVTHSNVEDGRFPDRFGGLMQRTASKISYRAVRNHGTLGGSVALADPSADWPACLLALGANVRVHDGQNAKSIRIAEFVVGQFATTLKPGEIIVGFDVEVPDVPLRWGSAKVVRKSGAFATSLAFAVQRGKGGPSTIVLSAASDKPCLYAKTAEYVHRSQITESGLRNAISADYSAHTTQNDAYLSRLHTSTVFRAVREMLDQ